MKIRRLRRLLGRASLYLVTGSLFLSGLLRIAGSAGEAIAQADFASAAHAEETMAKTEPHDAADSDEKALPPFDPAGLSRLVASLKARESKVEEREAAITLRLADLAAAEETLAENIEVLRLAEEQLQATLAKADGALESDIDHLTKVYETMKPKDAATLFEQMDPKFAAGFLSRMTPASASGVMAGLKPETAYAISLIFAGRHTDVPTE